MASDVPDILQAAFSQVAHAAGLPAAAVPTSFGGPVAEALLSGRRVVVRAPAGSGKTLAAWFPWLASRRHAFDFPSKLLHIVPGGTFWHDPVQRLRTVCASLDVPVGVQTESEAYDPFLLADAQLTTCDQALSIALHRPLGLYPGLANLHAGALLGAYLVFDEFPALASREALALWIGLLTRYYPFTACLWQSAVLPRPLLTHLAELLDADFIDASEAAGGGTRQWQSLPALTPDAILRQHWQRTLVVCNTVRGAQTLYRALRAASQQAGRKLELLLVHQYQTARDRLPLEARLAAIFGPGGTGEALVVTTSGIKVGADLSADTLITDPAPADVLLRRAGRCARFPGQHGQVLVAPVSAYSPGDTYPALPAHRLLALLADGASHTAAGELAALDTLWATATEDEIPAVLRAPITPAEVAEAPARILADLGTYPAALFPRVSACVHRLPETVADPFALERFSLAVSSLERGWRQWHASGCPGEWFALVPRWTPGERAAPAWTPVADPRDFRADARLIVLNSEAVSYDPIYGLQLAPGTAYQSEQLACQHTTWSPFDQHVESFTEHATRTQAAAAPLAHWTRYVLRHLGSRWGIPLIDLEAWLGIALAWHDAGKLTLHWQQAAHRWQSEGVRRETAGLLARIDYEARRDGRFPCPPHTVASGLGLSRAFALVLCPHPAVLQGTLAALIHHHGPQAVPGEIALEPHPDAWTTLLSAAAPWLDARQLRRLDRVGWTTHPRGLPPLPPGPPTDPDAWMAYSILARIIRLADREVALMPTPA